MGITDYVRHARIKRAKLMLKTTDKPIAAIARSVGFGDANYFTRSFKQDVGVTPKEYRKAEKYAAIDEK
jgi:two-component system response regulator YesN